MISRQSPNCIVKFVDTLLSSYHNQIYIGSYINCLNSHYTHSIVYSPNSRNGKTSASS